MIIELDRKFELLKRGFRVALNNGTLNSIMLWNLVFDVQRLAIEENNVEAFDFTVECEKVIPPIFLRQRG